MAEKGACFCGAVEYEVSGDAQVQGICHCNDCTSWAGAPVNAFSLFPVDAVTVTSGADNIGTYNKTPGSGRKFCKTCGGHIFTDHPEMGMIDVYHDTVPGLAHNPSIHVFYGEKTLAIKDGLPKFKDMPAEFGGSGDTLPE